MATDKARLGAPPDKEEMSFKQERFGPLSP